MEPAVLAAIIALGGAAIAALINAFVVEAYKRFRDGSAVAAALAGELASYAPAYPILRDTLLLIIDAVDDGNRELLALRKFERPQDRVFDKVIDKLGLLPVELIPEIVFLYGNLGGFRTAFEMLSSDHADMSDHELRDRAQRALVALENAAETGWHLLPRLKHRANTSFFRLPWPYD